MWQLCLASQPPVLISGILLLYCLQAPFWLGIRLPTSSFAQSARQARQLDLLHVLQGFVLGVLQEVSLALRMQTDTQETVRDRTHRSGPKAAILLSCVCHTVRCHGPGPRSCLKSPLPPVNASLWGRDWSPFGSPAPSSARKAAASTVGQAPRPPPTSKSPPGGNLGLAFRSPQGKAFALSQSTVSACQGRDSNGTR